MIEYGHNGLLVFLSLLVALVAGFTGLSLTKDLSSKSFSQRKIRGQAAYPIYRQKWPTLQRCANVGLGLS